VWREGVGNGSMSRKRAGRKAEKGEKERGRRYALSSKTIANGCKLTTLRYAFIGKNRSCHQNDYKCFLFITYHGFSTGGDQKNLEGNQKKIWKVGSGAVKQGRKPVTYAGFCYNYMLFLKSR